MKIKTKSRWGPEPHYHLASTELLWTDKDSLLTNEQCYRITHHSELTQWLDCFLAMTRVFLEVEVRQAGGNASEVNQGKVIGSEGTGGDDSYTQGSDTGGETKGNCLLHFLFLDFQYCNTGLY